jgi:hypothetical protein
LRGIEGIVCGSLAHHFARLSKNGSLDRSQYQYVAKKGCCFSVVMTLSAESKRGFGLVIGLAFSSLGSLAIAHTSSGEAATEQMARAQAIRLAPTGATMTSIECKEKDVGFSSRFRCTASWTTETDN